MPQLRPTIILTTILALCASAVILKTTRAADDPARLAQAQAVAPPAERSSEEPAAPSDGAGRLPRANIAPTAGTAPTPSAAESRAPSPSTPRNGPTRSSPPGTPQVPEESATIRDDPTLAPDPKQSADNNVSFPSDI